MSDLGLLVRVAVMAPVYGVFDYRLPDGIERLQAGVRVKVPFGTGRRLGIVLDGIGELQASVVREFKTIEAVLDTEPLLGRPEMRLGAWLAAYYHAPLGEVLGMMIPPRLREGAASMNQEGEMGWRLVSSAPAQYPRAPRLQEVLLLLRHAGGVLPDHALHGHAARLRRMLKRGWVERVRLDDPRVMTYGLPAVSKVELNPEQLAAVQSVAAALGRFVPFLLYGVTGSGKTEVYLAVMERVLAQGGQVLVLVPEIGLTPQLVKRFSGRLGQALVVLHSGLSEGARQKAWLKAREGRAGVVLGTRSAVFTPLPKLGLIVVDEEHDPSYKQQEGVRYHARDVAVMRAYQAGVPIILGSATPSLESLHNAQQGRYRLLRLTQRAAGASLPRLEFLDVRRRPMRDGLSAPLIERMREHLLLGGQVLLFLNRRGYAPILTCHTCGHVELCRWCSAPMIVHRQERRLICHHCGAIRPLLTRCPACGSEALEMQGVGTERLEDAVQGLFPEFACERVDRDTTRRRGALEGKLARARQGEAKILLGTQMLAKGHDFPGVSLAAVLDADRGLFASDFRAPERLLQLIVQVAGRAGRANRPGEVLIQTHQPEHPLLQTLRQGGFEACAKLLLHERRQAGLPPFSRLALLRAEGKAQARVEGLLAHVRAWLAEEGKGVRLYGPAPAPLERRAGRFRYQLLLAAARHDQLHPLLDRLLLEMPRWPQVRGVRWSLDVDPQDLG